MGSKMQALQAIRAVDWAQMRAERLECGTGCTVFSQGDTADTVVYIERGGVRLSVVSCRGKEAVIAILESGDFFGESCLAGQPKRLTTATTMGPATMLVIPQEELIRQLHRSSAFSDHFLAHVLKRNLRTERDLTDQLFNCSEKRLARTLLLLAQANADDARPIPKVSQEILAEMIGTSRTRVNFFMNRFRDLGYIDYKSGGNVTVHPSLVSVLHDR